ncbi:serum amyloid P-component [Ictalurus furcatus]|uniref:serum amyloid P-component n=1 Tax=Ictalurus furcatus TaxID=66913 RepID=UPI002350A708|nr:serum amyloid P-component [Ictalurus furcatus]
MARILFFFWVFALNTDRPGAASIPLSTSGTTPSPSITSAVAWETRNLGGWMFSVMPGAVVRFRSVALSNVTGITLCLRAVTEKKWMIDDYLSLMFGKNPAVSIMRNYNSDYLYKLQVAGYQETFNIYSMVPVQEVHSLWKSRCLTWDSSSGMAQLWFDGRMSVRKGLSRGTVFSGQAELTMTEFEGQVSDVYMWNSVLSVRELNRYLHGHSVLSRGHVLAWTQMEFSASGYVVLQPAYPKQLPAGPAKHNKKKRMKLLKKRQRQEVTKRNNY